MNNKFCIPFLILLATCQVNAVELEKPISVYVNYDCEKLEADYITTKFVTGALIEANKIENGLPLSKLKPYEICEVRNEIIMDGLSFTLYKIEREKQRYISVYNGFDGSSILYGPFNE